MKYKKPLPPLDVVKKFFNYDPATGEITWKIDRGRRVKAGDAAGGVAGDGRLHLVLSLPKLESYLAHRIVWLLHYGEDPGDSEIDHWDHNPLNNKIENLRLATSSQNLSNRRPYNATGEKYIYTTTDGRYRVVINDKYIGRRGTLAEAIKLRNNHI
jgi:hypothetical protein